MKKYIQEVYCILDLPKDTIELDSGAEFHGAVEKYFNDKNIRIKYALTNRHRQQGLVERKNQILRTLIHLIQTHKELETGKINREWTKIFSDLVREINKNLPKPITEATSDDPLTNSYNKKLLNIGDKVRIQLDYPVDTQGYKLHGEFRSTDMRWSQQIYIIKEVLLEPGKPPMYLTSKANTVAYTKEQLQPTKIDSHFV